MYLQTEKGEAGQTMLSARIHQYDQPLVVESVPKPRVAHGDQVLVKVAAAGLCHSDLHLISGEWKDAIPIDLPKIPGHEVAGFVEELGDSVPEGLFAKRDLVAIFGGWGCGICTFCKRGDEQMCKVAKWPGLSSYDGGFAQYILVPSYRFLIKANPDGRSKLAATEVAPLTDAGLTPYRAVKKVRHMLGPGTSIAVIGIGGLGAYAIQYARLLAPNSTVIGIDRSDSKLSLAENFGADFTVNSGASKNLREEVLNRNGGKPVDVVIDAVGAQSTTANAFQILGKGGALVLIGLFGDQVNVPLFPAVVNEYQVMGSLWGNYNELQEVLELARQRKIKHAYHTYPLSDVNDAIEYLRAGKIAGRAVIVP